jgi:hypothetical protein
MLIPSWGALCKVLSMSDRERVTVERHQCQLATGAEEFIAGCARLDEGEPRRDPPAQ